jgi:chromate transporter
VAIAACALTLLAPDGELLALLAAAAFGYFYYRRPGSPHRLHAAGSTLAALAWVFLKAGALLFGGGYVLIPLVEPEVVEVYGWMSRAQFLDGIAIGQITPGPITTTATFVGFVAGGPGGALVATAAIFVPSFLFVLFGTGPLMERLRNVPALVALLKGVNPAVVGTIAAAAAKLAAAAVVNPWTGAILALTLVALIRFKVDAPTLIAAAALAGWLCAGWFG